jgi:hypothetical protein
MQRQNRRELDRRADGISEVVGFVVILAVVMAGLSLYLTYAVPVQGREGEIKVMDDVRAWFVDYKTEMDQLWLNSPLVPQSAIGIEDGQTLFNATVGQVTVRKVLNAGTLREKGFVERYMPVLAPIPASAEVSVRNEERFTVSGWRNGNLTPDFTWTGICPALGYTSHNNYWLQQEYYYQLGGVFLRQTEGGGPETENVTVIAAAPLSIYDPSVVDPSVAGLGEQTKVEIVIVDPTIPTGGFGATSPIRVEARLDQDPSKPGFGIQGNDFDRVSLQFNAANAKTALAWKNVFEGAATRNGLGSNAYTSGNAACINISEPANAEAGKSNVHLEMLLANCTMSLENVPTIIE